VHWWVDITVNFKEYHVLHFWLRLWAVSGLLCTLDLAFVFHKSWGFLYLMVNIIVWRITDFLGVVSPGCFSEIHLTLLLWQSSAFYFKWYILFNSDDAISISCGCYVGHINVHDRFFVDLYFQIYLNRHSISTHYIIQWKERLIMNANNHNDSYYVENTSLYCFQFINPARLGHYFNSVFKSREFQLNLYVKWPLFYGRCNNLSRRWTRGYVQISYKIRFIFYH
jgi:hypothetical protein